MTSLPAQRPAMAPQGLQDKARAPLALHRPRQPPSCLCVTAPCASLSAVATETPHRPRFSQSWASALPYGMPWGSWRPAHCSQPSRPPGRCPTQAVGHLLPPGAGLCSMTAPTTVNYFSVESEMPSHSRHTAPAPPQNKHVLNKTSRKIANTSRRSPCSFPRSQRKLPPWRRHR